MPGISRATLGETRRIARAGSLDASDVRCHVRSVTPRRGISRRTALGVLGSAATTLAVTGRLPRAHAAAATDAPPGALRFGVQTAPQHTGYREIAEVWEEADGLPYDSAFVFDHFMPISGDPRGPCLEGWTLLSALAARTRRLRVGVLVTGNTYRFPAVLAKMAATVDHVSNGRLILGMGAGWFGREHEAYGIPFSTAGGRAQRLVEAVEVVKALCTRESATYEGKYYRLKDAPFVPRTVQQPHPPLLIGGVGPKVVQPLAARHAQIWHFFAPDPARARTLCTEFDALCRRVGRDPAEVEKSTSLRSAEVAGLDARALRTRVQELADAGVRHFILGFAAPFDRALLRRFAADVAAPLRAEAARRA
jgi:F420-dependent oxidoreductase-like protein